MNTMNYNTKKLNISDIQTIYHSHLIKHFPADEVKPLSYILQMYKKDIYCGYGLFHEEVLLSYAFFASVPARGYYLLDYYAVLPKYRNSGIGAVFLTFLQELFNHANGFFIEVENPDCSVTEEEKKIRLRRISFYLSQGVKETPIFSRQFGVDYKLLFLAIKSAASADVLYQELDKVYHVVFTPEILKTHMELWIAD